MHYFVLVGYLDLLPLSYYLVMEIKAKNFEAVRQAVSLKYF